MNKVLEKAEKYTGRKYQSRTVMPEQLVKDLRATYDKLGKFTIPIKDFNKELGYDHDKSRGWAIAKKLNSDNSIEGFIWKIGSTDKNTKYTVDIIEVEEPEESEELED